MQEYKLQYDQDKDAESWANFCEWRGKVAGLVSGERKQKEQAEKLVYLFELLAINRVPEEQITYSLLQWLSKQLDGRSLDKDKCLSYEATTSPIKPSTRCLRTSSSYGLLSGSTTQWRTRKAVLREPRFSRQ